MARKRVGSERKALLGWRLQQAALQAGYKTQTEFAEAFGVSSATVSRWWNGVQVPEVDELQRYADLVGKRPWWFYINSGDDKDFELAAEVLREIFGLTVRGARLSEAFDRATGEPDHLSRSERRQLDEGTPALRTRINREAPAPWTALQEDQQREVVDLVVSEGLHPKDLLATKTRLSQGE